MVTKFAYYAWIFALLAGFFGLLFGKGAVIFLGFLTAAIIVVIGILIFTMYLHDAAKYGTFNYKKWPNQ